MEIDSRLILCTCSFLISLIVAVEFFTAGRRITWRSLPTGKPSRPGLLTVIIPARNEEADLARALDSVLAQADVKLEAIVVNDHSSDRTGEVADSMARSFPQLRVLHDPLLPPGWLGKCNAMQQAAAMARGDVLLFTDADIIHDPRCFTIALAELERRELDFLSLFPRMEFVSTWENIILPALVSGLALFATSRIEDPQSNDALAAGAFLMIRSQAFRAIGGFEPIKGKMLDDVELARLVKRSRRRVGFYAAPQLLSVRLYKSNRHAFWGMTKNVLEGLNGRLWLAPIVILLPILVFWVPIYCMFAGLVEGNVLLASTAASTYVIQYAMPWIGRTIFQFHPGKALLFPLCAVAVIACMGKALYLYVVRGAVEWRGRTVRVRGGAAGG